MESKVIPEIDSFSTKYLFKIGIASLFVLFLIIFFFNSIKPNKNIPFNIYFNYTEGLNIGSNVEIAGIKIGEVTGIQIVNSKVLVSGNIENIYDIPNDSIAQIRSNGIFGKKSLLIEPGYGDIMLKDKYEFINSKDSYSVDMFLRYLNNIND